MQRLFLTIFVAGLSLSLVGCGERGPATTPVSITINHKGTPLADATVTLVSTDGQGNSAAGRTDSSGVATLETPPSWKGVIPGEYAVAVVKWEAKTVPDPTEEAPDGTRTEQTNILPGKYGEHSQSGFTLTVGNRAVQESFNIDE